MESDIDILLVEDTKSDALLAVHALHSRSSGPRIQVFVNGKEALDFIFCRGAYRGRAFPPLPKMILLDMNPPVVDGLQVLQAIKGDLRTRATPVVILTSSREHKDLIENDLSGVNAVIEKPGNFRDFCKTIQGIAATWLTSPSRVA
jgi:CheY-like chemotaxis protein